jgi:hypothetical protein
LTLLFASTEILTPYAATEQILSSAILI